MAYESTDSAQHPVLVSEDFRTMSVPIRTKVLGCVGDRRVRRVWFEVPRYCDGTDMGGYDVQVHFVGAGGTGDWNPAQDVDVGEDVVSFCWEPSSVAFEGVGEVKASVRMTDGSHEFNSGTGTFKVVEALRNDPHGSPLVDDADNLIVITVLEESDGN